MMPGGDILLKDKKREDKELGNSMIRLGIKQLENKRPELLISGIYKR